MADRSYKPMYLFYALRRSGHHAVINWILWSVPGTVLFRNDRIIKDGMVVKPGKVLLLKGRHTLNIPQRIAELVWDRMPFIKRAENFEDVFEFEFGIAKQTIIVIRDFYNNMASRLQWEREFRNRFRDEGTREQEVCVQMQHAKDLWKRYARIAIDSPPALRVIFFDKWVSDPGYREKLCEQLAVKGHPEALKVTAGYGPGSSFEGMQNSPDSAKLLRRFEMFREDPFFRELAADDEIFWLNQQLFGDTPSNAWAVSVRQALKD